MTVGAMLEGVSVEREYVDRLNAYHYRIQWRDLTGLLWCDTRTIHDEDISTLRNGWTPMLTPILSNEETIVAMAYLIGHNGELEARIKRLPEQDRDAPFYIADGLPWEGNGVYRLPITQRRPPANSA